MFMILSLWLMSCAEVICSLSLSHTFVMRKLKYTVVYQHRIVVISLYWMHSMDYDTCINYCEMQMFANYPRILASHNY